MANLLRCADCGSFAAADVCPHCSSARLCTTKLGALATVLGSSAFAMTLMACYGSPYGPVNPGGYVGPTYGGPVPDGGPRPLDGGSDAASLDAGALDAAALDAATNHAGSDARVGAGRDGAAADASAVDASVARDAGADAGRDSGS